MVALELHIGLPRANEKFCDDLQKIIDGMRFINTMPDNHLELAIQNMRMGQPLHLPQPAGPTSNRRSKSLDSVTARRVIKKLCGPDCLYVPCSK